MMRMVERFGWAAAVLWVLLLGGLAVLLAGCARPQYDLGMADSLELVATVNAITTSEWQSDDAAHRARLSDVRFARLKQLHEQQKLTPADIDAVQADTKLDADQRLIVAERVRKQQVANGILLQLAGRSRSLGQQGQSLYRSLGIQSQPAGGNP